MEIRNSGLSDEAIITIVKSLTEIFHDVKEIVMALITTEN